MAINPRPPRLGPVDFNHRHGSDFVAPPHLIKRQAPGVGVDPSMLPDADIDISYDPAEILAAEPIPQVRPIFLGLRKVLADRRIERSNDRLQDLARKHNVLRYAGRAILSGNSYAHAEINGEPNRNRPSTQEEVRAVEKLGKIHTKRRRAGTRVHGTSHNMTPPVHATWSESKEANKNRARHLDAQNRVNRHNEEFRAVVRRPSEEATRIIASRARAVAMREAINQANERRTEKIRQVRESVDGSARALGDEIIDRHYESWDMTKEQAKRVKAAAKTIGPLAVRNARAAGSAVHETGRKTRKHLNSTFSKASSRMRSKKNKRDDN
ncbi:MAG TPA: hypothetical protein VFH99_03515 [Candidatus Saccharimonadales bacterium]|nr:hypothetical protein [Candidatus Saccharimonadales bacterium]